MRARHSFLLLSAVACGGDDDKPIGDPLAKALDKSRASTAALCAIMDECYPNEVEEAWCNAPELGGVSGLGREWPPAVADSCWEPLYAADPQAARTLLACANAANESFATCLASCPDDVDASDCWDDYYGTSDACYPPFERAVGNERIEVFEDCMDRLSPILD